MAKADRANRPATSMTRRQWLGFLGALGIGSTTFQRALAFQAVQQTEQGATVTAEMIQQAEWICGLKLSDADRRTLATSMTAELRQFRAMRAVTLPNGVSPAIGFNPAPWLPPVGAVARRPVEPTSLAAPQRPYLAEELAFLPVTALSALIRTKQISSLELTKVYLERLRRYDPVLHCVVTLTEELALKQAEAADREIAAGRYRGPLHGIPWGAKDLIAYPGYKTTWGATPYKDQVIDTKATVAQRLEDAGAVLVAKLSTGVLAHGDTWIGVQTRNPWNPRQGSGGSSAGPGSATAAGLVGFSIGTETFGSIVQPSSRCGATGLRPTYGRVSRHGCMTLAWSMDKVGPIARSVEDCALVFGAIHGFDGLDPTAVDRPFAWPPRRQLHTLRVGYVEGGQRGGGQAGNREELRVLRELGVQLVPIKLPATYPVQALRMIMNVEAAAVFDDIGRQGLTEGLSTRPAQIRQGQFIPAVEYVRANRIRSLVMQEMEKLMQTVDLYVGGNDSLLTNLTGHPTIALPNGFRTQNEVETPTALTFTGRLYGEIDLLAVAHAYQRATGHHLRHPPMDKLIPAKPDGGP
jgi:Asp-tRNA(Asn)/Glu-tRNA(Gln) amidotransferase A subunit family amidase